MEKTLAEIILENSVPEEGLAEKIETPNLGDEDEKEG
jgi:hypothetical protein